MSRAPVSLRPSVTLGKAAAARRRATAAAPVVLVQTSHSVDGWTTLYAVHRDYDGVCVARLPITERFDAHVGSALSLALWSTMFEEIQRTTPSVCNVPQAAYGGP